MSSLALLIYLYCFGFQYIYRSCFSEQTVKHNRNNSNNTSFQAKL